MADDKRENVVLRPWLWIIITLIVMIDINSGFDYPFMEYYEKYEVNKRVDILQRWLPYFTLIIWIIIIRDCNI